MIQKGNTEMANAVQYQQQGFFAQGQLIAVKWFRTREGMRAKLPFNKHSGKPAMQWFKPADGWAPRHNEVTLARIVDSGRMMALEFVPGDPAELGQRVYEETQAALKASQEKKRAWEVEQKKLEEAVQAAVEMANGDDAIDEYIRKAYPHAYNHMWRTWVLKGETRPENILEIMRKEARGKVK